jgi:hypothetical protein
MAYAAKKGAKQFEIIDGVAGPEYDGIIISHTITFSFSPDNSFEYLVIQDGKLGRVHVTVGP